MRSQDFPWGTLFFLKKLITFLVVVFNTQAKSAKLTTLTVSPSNSTPGYAHALRISGVTRERGGGRTAPDVTLQGGDTRTEKNFVGKFTKNCGQTRSGR